MTKQEFLNLPTNRNTVATLKDYASRLFKNDSTVPASLFFMEAAQYLQDYAYATKRMRSLLGTKTTEDFLNLCIRTKEAGYRKELNLPF